MSPAFKDIEERFLVFVKALQELHPGLYKSTILMIIIDIAQELLREE